MPLVCYVSERDVNAPLDADRLLRLLGASGKLSGFYYAVYMLEQVKQKPDHVLLITKRLYKQTAQHFGTTSNCVERNLRTLVQACWRQPDHGLLDRIAGSRQPILNLLICCLHIFASKTFGFVRGGGILYLSHYISAEKGPYGSIRDFLG